MATALDAVDLPVRAGGQSEMRMNGAAIRDGPRTSRQRHLLVSVLFTSLSLYNLLHFKIVDLTVESH